MVVPSLDQICPGLKLISCSRSLVVTSALFLGGCPAQLQRIAKHVSVLCYTTGLKRVDGSFTKCWRIEAFWNVLEISVPNKEQKFEEICWNRMSCMIMCNATKQKHISGLNACDTMHSFSLATFTYLHFKVTWEKMLTVSTSRDCHVRVVAVEHIDDGLGWLAAEQRGTSHEQNAVKHSDQVNWSCAFSLTASNSSSTHVNEFVKYWWWHC